jgi:membrane fusion protein (multidrug efflux system)
VTSGLKVGDQLIVEGLQRARPNQPVNPVPAGSAGKKGGKPGAGPASAPASGAAPAAASAASKGG